MDAMPQPNQTTSLRGLTLLLYQRALHPELFKILASEQVIRRAYEADIWLVEGGHVITFTAGKNTLTEVIVDQQRPADRSRPAAVDPLPRRKVPRDDRRRKHPLHDQHAGRAAHPDALRCDQARDRAYAAKRELMTAESPGDAGNRRVPQRAGHRTPQPRAARPELPPVR